MLEEAVCKLRFMLEEAEISGRSIEEIDARRESVETIAHIIHLLKEAAKSRSNA